MIYTFKTLVKKGLSDTNTPVELYLKLRDQFQNCFLLESSEYKSRENSYSYICLQPLASFIAERDSTSIQYPDGRKDVLDNSKIDLAGELNAFAKSFDTVDLNLGFVNNGLFGYTSYDAIPFFEDISFENKSFKLPLLQYHFFRFLIVFNHFNNEIFLLEHLQEGESSQLNHISELISKRAITPFDFSAEAVESSNFTDPDFLKAIARGIEHCYLGDVFQVVLSRKFRRKFKGDEFNVYRALRSINPSAYLFYFDYGDFKIFGSSPEAQLTIHNNTAVIHPIAGTFRRSGDAAVDQQLAIQLREDVKENAEHIMLVDLARNDLSKNSQRVKVDAFKEVEFYSHVIHLVSKVSAQLNPGFNPIRIFGDTYPAGTLSGAPKHKAMQIIDANEPESRGFYGGAVGLIGFNGSFNHAIFIRSFLSQHHVLTYQAGCGVVAKSNAESELEEVNNKLMALRKAIELANTL
ncbi:anthranilate synthase component I family protein [Flavobacterium sp. HSC-61S13]|uniref:anthranilate synthase component I family protein n=1 Tax=Flavobacterium sp. HSC-61S13 TaxID=2910963 RepID=UPI00209CBCB1|nr:anthranilate synthase component I family protein [Flavobacterium sp. HSC-61S13]MCP1997369.1 anthranilate synthase component 1 [Flavobacterium sp. HSC-61S13]